jgi:hypothetical protein
MHRLRYEIAAEAWRLLRVLFLRLNAVPTDPGGAFRQSRCRGLLSRVGKQSASDTEAASQRLIEDHVFFGHRDELDAAETLALDRGYGFSIAARHRIRRVRARKAARRPPLARLRFPARVSSAA